jgi:type III secretion protein V
MTKRFGINILPLFITLLIGIMVVPVNTFLLDLLILGSIAGSLLLFVSSFYLSDPLKLSSFPTILLLLTLYRLSLNVSTSRLLLATGDAGDVVDTFADMIINKDIFVGSVIFLIISIVQFIVIAKGAERTAEVSARFSLDALPGKQMAIDSDVRNGVLTYEAAAVKREELQRESKFYGALDGSIKFIKGDAIAAIIIFFINIAAGIFFGLLRSEYKIYDILTLYTSLSIGDGLLSQVTSLLNSLTAGIIVSKVGREKDSSIAGVLPHQLLQFDATKKIVFSVLILLLFVPSVPHFEVIFFILIALFITKIFINHPVDTLINEPVQEFLPEKFPLLTLKVPKDLIADSKIVTQIKTALEIQKGKFYESHGLVLPRIFIVEGESLKIQLHVRQIEIKAIDIQDSNDKSKDIEKLFSALQEYKLELIDDPMTKRIFEIYENEYYELINSLIPQQITITQITILLKQLIEENISIRHFDIILQAVSENINKTKSERILLEEIRCALRREISKYILNSSKIKLAVDELFDLILIKAESEQTTLDYEIILDFYTFLNSLDHDDGIIIVSKKGRKMLKDYLSIKKCRFEVYAKEEIIDMQIKYDYIYTIAIKDAQKRESYVQMLAA